MNSSENPIAGPEENLPLAVSIGEPAGIGPDIVLAAWCQRSDLPAFYVIGSASILAARARHLGLDADVTTIAAPAEAAGVFPHALPVLSLNDDGAVTPGRPSATTASLVTDAVAQAVADASAGRAAGIVTAPIHKDVLAAAGFAFPGHTEYLASLCDESASSGGPVMMLAAGDFRVVPLTVHMPLRAVPDALSVDMIVAKARIVATALARDFGIARPRLAMAGLNPHAGETGRMGTEETAILTPAADRLRAEGIDIRGPVSADTLFHPEARAKYDAALCMYHDQALIPLKTVDFWGGVNVTLGLPVVRTSPDHGTAFDLAGTGQADPASFIAALHLAAEMAARRRHLQAAS